MAKPLTVPLTAPPGDLPENPDAQQRFFGHRARLRDRYLQNGIDALHPHEIIEFLLTFVIHRRDTKPIAHELLKRYKTVGALLNAPVEELCTVEGIGQKSAVLFPLLRDIFGLCLKEKFERTDLVSHRRDVDQYLKFYFGYRRDEYVAALFLDAANHVLKTEIVGEGTVNQCALYPRVIIEKALRASAASMILAHNHPGGTASPSEVDWQITERLIAAGKLLELPLLDHIIICTEQVISLREMSRWPRGGA